MLLFDSTMSMFDSNVLKNGHSRYMALSNAMPSFGCPAIQDFTAAPKPYHPGSMSRHWAQLKTQGIALRSPIFLVFVRDAGRLPMFSVEISVMTVDAQKYSSKPWVSYTRARYASYAAADNASIAV